MAKKKLAKKDPIEVSVVVVISSVDRIGSYKSKISYGNLDMVKDCFMGEWNCVGLKIADDFIRETWKKKPVKRVL